MTNDRYALTQRLLHWIIAFLVLGALTGGWIIEEFSRKDFPKGVYSQIYDLHKAVGFIILMLMLCRIIARLVHGKPAPHPGLASWQRTASSVVHTAFYILLVVQPILGIVGVWSFPAPIPVLDSLIDNPLTKDRDLSKMVLNLHANVGKALIALAVLHIAAAFMHIFKRDGVFSRIGLGVGTRNRGGGEG